MRLICLGAAAVLWSGCAGRAAYFLVDATRSYQEALDAGAAQHAVYEMTLAEEYLRKAKEEAGYSDYEAAEKLALRATEEAQRALAITKEAEVPATDTTTVPDEAPPVAPVVSSPTPVIDP